MSWLNSLWSLHWFWKLPLRQWDSNSHRQNVPDQMSNVLARPNLSKLSKLSNCKFQKFPNNSTFKNQPKKKCPWVFFGSDGIWWRNFLLSLNLRRTCLRPSRAEAWRLNGVSWWKCTQKTYLKQYIWRAMLVGYGAILVLETEFSQKKGSSDEMQICFYHFTCLKIVDHLRPFHSAFSRLCGCLPATWVATSVLSIKPIS